VVILRVEPDSPAAVAGLVETRVTDAGEIIPGDIIQRVDGEPVGEMADLIEVLENYRIGDQVVLDLVRSGESIRVPVVLGGHRGRLD
jgi:S1-C subfamily serine protease